MKATLYHPSAEPVIVSSVGLTLPNPLTGYVQITQKVAGLLGYSAALIDVLDSSATFVAFSIFDHEGEINTMAMQVLSSLSALGYDPKSEAEQVRGPVLVITIS